MPLYDYRCVSCGDFREFRPMTESTTSRGCPVCGAPSERVLAAPFLAGMDPNSRIGHRRNDVTSFPRACGHAHGCSHSHGAGHHGDGG
jgi:putative FmdB family regulatory protein